MHAVVDSSLRDQAPARHTAVITVEILECPELPAEDAGAAAPAPGASQYLLITATMQPRPDNTAWRTITPHLGRHHRRRPLRDVTDVPPLRPAGIVTEAPHAGR